MLRGCELCNILVQHLFRAQQGHSMWLVQHCARDILEALAFLHKEGYVHADLKPRNILWSADDESFKLIDFGLSFKQGNQVGFCYYSQYFKLNNLFPNIKKT